MRRTVVAGHPLAIEPSPTTSRVSSRRPSVLASLRAVADPFRPVGLAQLCDAELLDRVDTKYVVSLDTAAALAESLRDTHAVLEIDGVREFEYRTTYFDTASLRMYR